MINRNISKEQIKKELAKRCCECRIGSCCKDGVEVDLINAMRISKLKLPLKRPWFEGLFENKDIPTGWALSTVVRDNRCIFQRKDKKCRIYTYRPKYCREFPFENDDIAQYYHYLCKESAPFKKRIKMVLKNLPKT